MLAFGQHRKFPPHARKTSGTQGSEVCNCDKNDNVWREDSGLLTDKTKFPVKQLGFGDVSSVEEGYHTLGKLKCFGIA